MKTLARMALLLAFGLLTACPGDKACNVTVHYFANIQNLTGQDVQLHVCRGGLKGPMEITVPSNQDGDFKLYTASESRIYTGGGADACENKIQSMSISLTSQSFQNFRFCSQTNSDNSITTVIVWEAQACPPDTVVQSMPVDNCSVTLQ
jgi:hypothetical protein